MLDKFKRFELDGWKLETKQVNCGYKTSLVNGYREIFIQLDRGLGHRKTSTLKDVEEYLKAYHIYDTNKEYVEKINALDSIEYISLKGVDQKLAIIIEKYQEPVYSK